MSLDSYTWTGDSSCSTRETSLEQRIYVFMANKDGWQYFCCHSLVRLQETEPPHRGLYMTVLDVDG